MMQVSKADGTRESFNPEKLHASLKRAGAAPEVAQEIAREIEQNLYEGIPTHEIYAKAFAHLREHRHHIAARYSLKRAVLEFGPSGFPFEAYLAELFRAEGCTGIAIDQIIQGACVEHEVDVVYQKDGQHIYTEAKFHNALGFKTDLKTVLYVKARIDDIAAAKNNERVRGLVATNTKFTSVAVQYATCQKLELLSWDYPQNHTLHDRIEAARLYPITALTTLSHKEKIALLSNKKVLCGDLSTDTRALAEAGVHGAHADQVLAEAGALCVPGSTI
jgi:ATP cone domain/Restriction endonuclease